MSCSLVTVKQPCHGGVICWGSRYKAKCSAKWKLVINREIQEGFVQILYHLDWIILYADVFCHGELSVESLDMTLSALQNRNWLLTGKFKRDLFKFCTLDGIIFYADIFCHGGVICRGSRYDANCSAKWKLVITREIQEGFVQFLYLLDSIKFLCRCMVGILPRGSYLQRF